VSHHTSITLSLFVKTRKPCAVAQGATARCGVGLRIQKYDRPTELQLLYCTPVHLPSTAPSVHWVERWRISSRSGRPAQQQNCRVHQSAVRLVFFSLDFWKAFDTARHETLMKKMATLELPDSIHNWIKDSFSDRRHCTRYAGQCLLVADIKASVIHYRARVSDRRHTSSRQQI